MDETQQSKIESFEHAAEERRRARYLLRLYVAGSTRNSIRALENIRAICERYLAGRYELEVIDLYQQPQRARQDQVIAVPTLVRTEPQPSRRIIGDLSNPSRVLKGLEIAVSP